MQLHHSFQNEILLDRCLVTHFNNTKIIIHFFRLNDDFSQKYLRYTNGYSLHTFSGCSPMPLPLQLANLCLYFSFIGQGWDVSERVAVLITAGATIADPFTCLALGVPDVFLWVSANFMGPLMIQIHLNLLISFAVFLPYFYAVVTQWLHILHH